MGAPPILSNFEAVKWLMKSFTLIAAHKLGQRLGWKSFAQSMSPAGQQVKVDRHTEDKYALKEVFREALKMVEDSVSSLYGSISPREPSCSRSTSKVTVKSSVAEIPVIEEAEIESRIESAFLRFKIVIKSRDEVISQRMGEFHQRLDKVEEHVGVKLSAHQSVDRPSVPTKSKFRDLRNQECAICGELRHVGDECPYEVQSVQGNFTRSGE
jgi:hypothetical protein